MTESEWEPFGRGSERKKEGTGFSFRQPAHKVELQFTRCERGDITFAVRVSAPSLPDQSVEVCASDVYDPFPWLIRWLEAIITDVQSCSATIDEEGPEKEFVAETYFRWEGLLSFEVREPFYPLSQYGKPSYVREDFMKEVEASEPPPPKKPKVFIRAIVRKRQLIECFYEGIRAFARSPLYRPEHWAELTLGEVFRMANPEWSDQLIAEGLLPLTVEKILRVFLIVESVLYDKDSLPAYAGFSKDFQQFVKQSLDAAGKQEEEGECCDPWRAFLVFKDYASYSPQQKLDFIKERMGSRDFYSQNGCRLDQLKSDVIEEYLASPEPKYPDEGQDGKDGDRSC